MFSRKQTLGLKKRAAASYAMIIMSRALLEKPGWKMTYYV